MKKKQTIEDFLENHQLFEALPMSWLVNNMANDTEKARRALYDAVNILHQINPPEGDEFWDNINSESLHKVNLYLTEQLYLLTHEDDR